MAQQTAVQWLALRYHHKQGYMSQEDIEIAKEIMKEQIMDAFLDGVYKASQTDEDYENFPTSGEQYYNETYNK